MAAADRDRCSDAVIIVPGVMGSELVDSQGSVVWGMSLGLVLRQVSLGDVLARITLPPDGADDGIRASRELQLPVLLPLLSGVEPYARLVARLRATALRPEAVRVFAYDWRRSIVDAARQLVDVADEHLGAWKRIWAGMPLAERRGLPEPRLSLVCHSMGGLVGRWFAEVEGGRAVLGEMVTLGTPYDGSLNALRVLADGDWLPFRALAHALRDAGRSFPGVYELVARYRCVPVPAGTRAGEAQPGGRRAVVPGDVDGVGASGDMAEAAFSVHEALQRAVAAAGPDACRPHCLVGVRQPTAQSVAFRDGSATFVEGLDGVDHGGDGTVYRYAAAPRDLRAMALPQSHGGLARSPEALGFIEAVLTDRHLGEAQGPEGFGLRAADAVAVGEPFEVVGVGAPAGAMATICDAETGVHLDAQPLLADKDGGTACSLRVGRPGLYRVSIAGGGYSDVERLVMVLHEV